MDGAGGIWESWGCWTHYQLPGTWYSEYLITGPAVQQLAEHSDAGIYKRKMQEERESESENLIDFFKK